MGLVEVAQLLRQLGAGGRAAGEAVGGFEQSVALDDPLRTDADVVLEEPLQGAFAQARRGGQLIDLYQCAVVRDASHQGAQGGEVRIGIGSMLGE